MPMPAAVSAAMTSTWPSSLRLTEAIAGAPHPRTAATRALTSGRIHAPVGTATGTPGHAGLHGTHRVLDGERLAPGAASRGWMCRARAPAATAAAPSGGELARGQRQRPVLIRSPCTVQAGLDQGANSIATRPIMRASSSRSSRRTRSSTRGRVDARRADHHRGDPARGHRRMSAPHGTPATRRLAAQLGRDAPRTSASTRGGRSVSPEANAPPVQRSHGGASPAGRAHRGLERGARRRGLLPHAHGDTALEREPVGHLLDHSPASTRPTSSG